MTPTDRQQNPTPRQMKIIAILRNKSQIAINRNPKNRKMVNN